MNATRRSIIGITAVVAFLAVVAGVVRATTHDPKLPACKFCGSPDTYVSSVHANATSYTCRSCEKFWFGPAQSSFSWMQAAEYYLSE